MDPLRFVKSRRVPQTQPANDLQIQNGAGGFSFELDDAARLRRFLTLGVDGGTYYASPHALAIESAAVLQRMAGDAPEELVATIVDVSMRGAATKQNPALFALAYAASVPGAASLALEALPQVARTGTHLFQFVDYVQQFRGWGRGLRRAVSNWYTSKNADQLAYQLVKYRKREGWSHRDMLRLAHPKTDTKALRDSFAWVTKGEAGSELPDIIVGFCKAQEATDTQSWTTLIRKYGLTWEMLPDAALSTPAVWDTLLDTGIPQTALMRQLPRLTRLGLLPALGGRTSEVATQLTNQERLRGARLHPINVLVAARTYASGRSARGSNIWIPTQSIVDALDAAFYEAFGAITPAGKRTMLAVDVSGSMGAPISGMPLTAREASAALALVQLATEPNSAAFGFACDKGTIWSRRNAILEPLAISPRKRLDDALQVIDTMPFGGTDCALPMLHATGNHLAIDTFVVYTDNETWAGDVHPHVALEEYRQASGIPAKLVVVGMTANKISIANPNDSGMLDVAGFDSAVPNLIADFSRD